MIIRRLLPWASIPLLFSAYLIFCDAVILAADFPQHIEKIFVFTSETETVKKESPSILVELFLEKDQKKNLDAIKTELAEVSITRVRAQFYRLGHPPENIAIGKGVPAPIGRLAIQMARTYNSGVKYLLPQFRFFPHHIAIGTSAFDEASQIPLSPEQLDQLSDPALTTPQFHALYRKFTTENERIPTYLER